MDVTTNVGVGVSAKIIEWMGNMFWLFKNIKKVRSVIDAGYSKAPICPREEARMIFENEVPNEYPNGKKMDRQFRRWYKCPACDYRMYQIRDLSKE